MLTQVRQALEYVREEQLVCYESIFFFFGFHLCAASSDYEHAKEWAVKARDAHLLLFGYNLYDIYERLVNDPTCYPDAGTMPEKVLSGPPAEDGGCQ